MFFACFATSVITIKLSFSTKREHDNFIPLRQSPLAAELFTPFASKNEEKVSLLLRKILLNAV